MEHEVRVMEQIAVGDCRCWLCERGRVSCPGGRGLAVTNTRVADSLAGGSRTLLKRGTETQEATEAELLLMGLQVGTSISLRPEALRGCRWISMEE